MPQIFLDGDGVLADFNKKATEILGMPPHEFEEQYGDEEFWRRLEEAENFFGSMEPMIDAHILLSGVLHLDPIILTGIRGSWCVPQKERFFARLCPGTKVICCPSREKFKHMTHKGAILVDDFLKHSQIWKDNGGIFVHHTSAIDSLLQLAELGVDVILPEKYQCPLMLARAIKHYADSDFYVMDDCDLAELVRANLGLITASLRSADTRSQIVSAYVRNSMGGDSI